MPQHLQLSKIVPQRNVCGCEEKRREGGRAGKRERESTNMAKCYLLNLRRVYSFNYFVTPERVHNKTLGKITPNVTSKLSRPGFEGEESMGGIL